MGQSTSGLPATNLKASWNNWWWNSTESQLDKNTTALHLAFLFVLRHRMPARAAKRCLPATYGTAFDHRQFDRAFCSCNWGYLAHPALENLEGIAIVKFKVLYIFKCERLTSWSGPLMQVRGFFKQTLERRLYLNEALLKLLWDRECGICWCKTCTWRGILCQSLLVNSSLVIDLLRFYGHVFGFWITAQI